MHSLKDKEHFKSESLITFLVISSPPTFEKQRTTIRSRGRPNGLDGQLSYENLQKLIRRDEAKKERGDHDITEPLFRVDDI